MNKFVGVAIGLAIAAHGLTVVCRETQSLKASRRKTASIKAFNKKLLRSSDVALEVYKEKQEKEMARILAERNEIK